MTLVELLVGMAILSIVLAALGQMIVSGTNAEVDLNRRLQAQTEARLALDIFRRDIHAACSATLTGSTKVTLNTLSGTQCTVASSTWCTSGSGSKYALYRQAGGSCSSSTGVKRADSLINGSIFSKVTAAGLIPKVAIDLTVNTKPSKPRLQYRLQDAVVMRNAARG